MKNRLYFLSVLLFGIAFISLSTPAQQRLDSVDVRIYDNSIPPDGGTYLVSTPTYREFRRDNPTPSSEDAFFTSNGTAFQGGNIRRATRTGSTNYNTPYAHWYCSTANTGSYIVYYHVNIASANNNAYVKLWKLGESTPSQYFRFNMLNCLTPDLPVAYGSWFPLSIINLAAADSALTLEIGADTLSGTTLHCDAAMLVRSRKSGPDIEFGARRFTRAITNGTDTLVRHNMYTQRAPYGFGEVIYQNNGYKDRDLTIFNLGTQPLTISGYTSQTSRFSVVTALPCTIEPGQKKDITLRFKPLGEEYTYDTLVFINNDSGEPEAKLPVVGHGTSYNFIMNASPTGSEPHWNVPVEGASFTKSGSSWSSSVPSPISYPISGGNINSVVNTSSDRSINCQYTLTIPDSLAGLYYLDFSGPAGSSNAAQQVTVDVITPGYVNPIPALGDTQRVTGFNQRLVQTNNLWVRIGSNTAFTLNGQGQTIVRFTNPNQGSDYLRADLLRFKKIPVAPSISTSLDPIRLLNFGQVSVYDTARQRQQNFRKTFSLNSRGELPLTVDTIFLKKGQVFHFNSMPVFPLLLPVIDGRFNLAVDFLPAVTGNAKDTIIIVTNDPADANITVILSGEGVQAVTGVSDRQSDLPRAFQLMQNFPNPFNPVTTIKYALPEKAMVSLSIYNQIGQKIATLIDGEQNAGYHSVDWKAGSFASGIYFYELKAGSYTSVRKLILLK